MAVFVLVSCCSSLLSLLLLSIKKGWVRKELTLPVFTTAALQCQLQACSSIGMQRFPHGKVSHVVYSQFHMQRPMELSAEYPHCRWESNSILYLLHVHGGRLAQGMQGWWLRTQHTIHCQQSMATYTQQQWPPHTNAASVLIGGLALSTCTS